MEKNDALVNSERIKYGNIIAALDKDGRNIDNFVSEAGFLCKAYDNFPVLFPSDNPDYE